MEGGGGMSGEACCCDVGERPLPGSSQAPGRADWQFLCSHAEQYLCTQLFAAAASFLPYLIDIQQKAPGKANSSREKISNCSPV